MKFLNLLLTMAGLMVATSQLSAAPVTSFKDVDKAKAAAKEQKKPVFLLFTGTEWCHWCQKLEAEVLTKKEFKDYAQASMITCVLDFPSAGAPKKFQGWQKDYKVSGFPTVIILDSEGKQIGQTGYQAGGPEKYVESLKKILPAAPKADAKPADKTTASK